MHFLLLCTAFRLGCRLLCIVGCSSPVAGAIIRVAGLRTTASCRSTWHRRSTSAEPMENRASVTKRYPSCYHLRSLVLLSEPEMENAVSPPGSLDTHSPYLRIASRCWHKHVQRGQERHAVRAAPAILTNLVLHQEPATTIPHAPAHLLSECFRPRGTAAGLHQCTQGDDRMLPAVGLRPHGGHDPRAARPRGEHRARDRHQGAGRRLGHRDAHGTPRRPAQHASILYPSCSLPTALPLLSSSPRASALSLPHPLRVPYLCLAPASTARCSRTSAASSTCATPSPSTRGRATRAAWCQPHTRT